MSLFLTELRSLVCSTSMWTCVKLSQAPGCHCHYTLCHSCLSWSDTWLLFVFPTMMAVPSRCLATLCRS
jgi:hypothetical protein